MDGVLYGEGSGMCFCPFGKLPRLSVPTDSKGLVQPEHTGDSTPQGTGEPEACAMYGHIQVLFGEIKI